MVNAGDGSVAGKILPASGNAPAGAFTSEHIAQIAIARKSSAKIRRACSVAKFSGVTTAVFAALTIVFSLTSLTGLLLGMGMAIVSIFEFRGVSEFTRLDPTAPKRLAINQIAFATMLILYSAVSYWNYVHSPEQLSAVVSDRQVADMIDEFKPLINSIMAAVYIGVAIAALIGPGLTAVYYYSRKRYIEDYIANTPQWIQDLQKAGMSL
jgi:hypothetical protein